MQAHRVEKIIQSNGVLILENLPFEAGKKVEVIVLEAENGKIEPVKNNYPLRGSLYKYDDPFEPVVPIEDWEAL